MQNAAGPFHYASTGVCIDATNALASARVAGESVPTRRW